MKKIFLILFCILSVTLSANNKKPDKIKEAKAREWVKNQPLEFFENRGQFTNTDGNPADNVLFKTSFGNCDIYITNKGLSYVFVKYEEDKEKGKREKEKVDSLKFRGKEVENRKVSYYRLDMDLVEANIDKANIIKEQEGKQGHYNYFYAHCPEGIYNVKGYGKITIKNIYKGIDWVIYTNANSKEHPLKYDFVVHPQADYKQIKIKFINAQSTTLADNDTKLKIQTIAGNIEEGNLYSYTTSICHAERSEASQLKTQTETKNTGIESNYKINQDSLIEFEIANYDTTKTLIIDPLVWATYYGGSGNDEFTSICADNQDNILITGQTLSIGFPTIILSGAYWQSNSLGNKEIFILKFNNQGIRQWATYYGGSNNETGNSICSDSQGNIYITGWTESTNFPIQQLAGGYYQTSLAGENDAVILKFSNQGVRQWATFYGGISSEYGTSISVDSQNNIYITGETLSSNFPIQSLIGAYNQVVYAENTDAFILKFNANGVRQWATFYGGSNYDIGKELYIDNQDNIFVIGETFSSNFPTMLSIGGFLQDAISEDKDAFILKFSNLGVRQWATFYGGNKSDNIKSIFVGTQGNIYITGYTNSSNFPTQELIGAYWQPNNAGPIGTFDAFLLMFNNQCIRQWATYYGGISNDNGNSICVNNQDDIYITGKTGSSNFPTQFLSGEYWKPTITGNEDAFILKINNQGVVKWATFYGSSSKDFGSKIIIDNQNLIYCIGEIGNSGAYTYDYGNGAYFDSIWNGNTDGCILKINPCNIIRPVSVDSDRNNICINDNGNITLTAIGGIGDTLKWYSGNCGQNYIGKNTPLTILSPTQTSTYYARWESSCDTSACDSIIIYVIQPTFFNQNQNICQGETYTVGTHNYTTTGIYTDTLSTYLGCDSIITTNLTVNSLQQTTLNPVICQGETFIVGIHNYTSTGTYTDILTTYLGCDSIVTINLTVKPSPIVNLGIDRGICEGETFELTVNSGYESYLWQDGSINNSFVVSQIGKYWVTVVNDDCIKSDTINFIVCPEEINIWIPSAFTPNNDGNNDVFQIIPTEGIVNIQGYIYNRWGEVIYLWEGFSKEKSWNGKVKNQEAMQGIYYYVITYEDLNGKKFEKKGSVTLIR